MLKIFLILFAFIGMFLPSIVTASEPSEFAKKYEVKLEKMLCRKLEGDRTFKSISGYANRKGSSIEDFFQYAKCSNKTGVDQNIGMRRVIPMQMIILKPQERLTAFSAFLNLFDENHSLKRLTTILNRKDKFQRTPLDFLEEQYAKIEKGTVFMAMYNTIRSRICRYGGQHAKPENVGKCSKVFLRAHGY